MRIGEASLRPVVEQEMLLFPPTVCISDFSAADLEPHADWLCPQFVDRASGHLKMSHHAWLVEVSGARILVDPCVGNGRHRPLLPFYDNLATPWLDRLKAMGAEPESIDYVFCTHMHIDHVGWNTRLENGRMVPTFPNARYLMPKAEDEFWRQDLTGDLPPSNAYNAGIYAECVLPVIQAGLVDLVEEGASIAGCLSLVEARGHTPGHMAGVLRSAGAGAVLCGDAIHHPIEVLYPGRHGPQFDPIQASETVRRLLELCVETDYWLAPAHFAAPHMCKVRKEDGGYRMVWPAPSEDEVS